MSNIDDNIMFLWRIENFHVMANISKFAASTPSLPTTKLLGFDVFALIYTVGEDISIFLEKGDKYECSLASLDIEFGLINKNGEEQIDDHFACQKQGGSRVPLFRKSVILENKDELIPNDTLTVVCRVRKVSNRGLFPGMKIYIHTEIFVERTSFIWTIRNPNLDLFKRIMRVESELFESGFVLKCESLNIDEKNLLNLVIRPKVIPETGVSMSATIQALCSRKRTFSKVEDIYGFNDKNLALYLQSLDISGLIRNSQEEVDLSCEFTISVGSNDTVIEEVLFLPDVKFKLDELTLKDDFRAMYTKTVRKYSPEYVLVNEGGNTDIILRTSNCLKAIPAHKMILAARSPMLNEILTQYNIKKNNWLHVNGRTKAIRECRVTAGNHRFKVSMNQGLDTALIPNISLLTLSQMVVCMYTDTLDITNMEHAILLYKTGTNFQFNLLKTKCRDYLRTLVSISTLGHLLPFAYEVGDVWIKNDFFNFIAKNRKLVLSSEEWFSLCTSFKNLEHSVLASIESNGIFN